MSSPSVETRFWNLSRLRLMVQLVLFGVTVYGGLLVGPYLSDKISDALPALSCAFDQSNGAYCVLIPLQHQMHHRVGEAIVRLGGVSLDMFVPLFFTLVTFFVFFVFLNKGFCGWVCPLGTAQELLYRLGRWFKLGIHRLTGGGLKRVRPVKWLILLLLVFTLPLLAGLGVAPHAAGDAYCQICPSRILTTLLTANMEQMAVSEAGWLDFTLSALRNLLFGFMLVAALTVRQPFCRICPMLAFHALARRFSFLQLDKQAHDRCQKCEMCVQACPMDIPEISNQHGPKAFHEDCTLCGRCAEFCPDDDVIRIRFLRWPLFRSAAAYFRSRTRLEKPDGTPRPLTKKTHKKGTAHG
ncbi:MAG: 4Fe-4S binding protein [Magnetococcales bacterium]|nr:4Fe-4S binding protein [Magnetococcales bacterium]